MVNMVGSCNMLRAPGNPVPGAGQDLEASARATVVGASMVARGKLADTMFLGAVMSEQAVMRAVAIIALRMRGLRRIIESPELGKVLPSSTAIGLGYAKSSLPANEDLPAGQELVADEISPYFDQSRGSKLYDPSQSQFLSAGAPTRVIPAVPLKCVNFPVPPENVSVPTPATIARWTWPNAMLSPGPGESRTMSLSSTPSVRSAAVA